MRSGYSFSVLRYVHDGVTGEFVNIGVALYCPDLKYLRAMCSSQYGRITKVFDRIDGERFKQLVRYIQDAVNRLGESMRTQLEFEPIGSQTLEKLLTKVLPPDDSSVQFSPAGVGLSEDLDVTLCELFERYVGRYAGAPEVPSRSDDEVWRVFRDAMQKHHVLQHLAPKHIFGTDYDFEFKAAWKNEIWHVIEPVSFDLMDGASIVEKANRWVGRANSLMDSSERFRMHLLLGPPQDRRLEDVFGRAQRILRKMPGDPELVDEGRAEDFAMDLEREIGVQEPADRPVRS